MTPTEALANLEAARKRVDVAERDALLALASDWLTRARESIPTPAGAIEEHTPLMSIVTRYTSHMTRTVTKLLSTTPAGGVRLQQIVQSTTIRLSHPADSMGPIRSSIVSEMTYAGNTRDGKEWRAKFEKVTS